MIFLLGFPTHIYADLLKNIVRSSPNEMVSGLPSGEWGGYSKQYIGECFETLVAFHKGRPTCFEKGLAVIGFKPFGVASIDAFTSFFYPFAIVREVSIDRRVAPSGGQLARDKNEVSRQAVIAVKKALKVRNQVTTYLTSRCNRTPFLLPIGHFGDNAVARIVKDAWGALKSVDDATSVLDDLAKKFENQYPFTKMKRSTGYFVNARGVEFRSPGRDLHGITHPDVDGHEELCFFNGSLRVGGQIRKGFHYDCTHKGGKYSGIFENCHGEQITKEGNPHLNIYPNDFVR